MALIEGKAGQGKFAIEIEPLQLKQLFSLLSALPKDSQNEIRTSAQGLSKRFAGQLFMFSQSAPAPQTKLVAQSITTPRDRLIRVDIGGSKKVGRKYGGETSKSGKGKKVRQQQAPAGALLWGTEYGSHVGVDTLNRRYTNRFKAPLKKSGYWINPATDFYAPIVAKEYIQLIKDVVKKVGLN
jgi:hypothetical protein